MLVGYMRVSKADGSQTTDLQRDALIGAGVEPDALYEDKASGKKEDRPELAACLYDDADARGYPYGGCNLGLKYDMQSVCNAAYPRKRLDPRWHKCYDAADIYWVAVTATHRGQN